MSVINPIFARIFHRGKRNEPDEMKYLIACLGNIGAEYENTRHNIGFKIADRLAKDLEATFTTSRLAQVAEMRFKGKTLVVIKPTTYMNLSGKAVKYWLNEEKIPMENLLVVNDDIALPLGTLRLRKQGADGGHNGLTDIIEKLGTNVFCRLRFGLGDDFPRGRQIDFVLGQWKASEEPVVDEKVDVAVEIIKSFVTQGPDRTMNQYNKK
jgi:PTH1 family peptidyl-tRNA hydrolase